MLDAAGLEAISVQRALQCFLSQTKQPVQFVIGTQLMAEPTQAAWENIQLME